MLIVCFGIVLVLIGAVKFSGTIIWRIESLPDFLDYGMYYAENRYMSFKTDLWLSGCLVIFGILLLLVALYFSERCSGCGRQTIKRNNFCPTCGKQLR